MLPTVFQIAKKLGFSTSDLMGLLKAKGIQVKDGLSKISHQDSDLLLTAYGKKENNAFCQTPWFQLFSSSIAFKEKLFPDRKLVELNKENLRKFARIGPQLVYSSGTQSHLLVEAPIKTKSTKKFSKSLTLNENRDKDKSEDIVDLASSLWSELSRAGKSVCGRASWESDNTWLPQGEKYTIHLRKGSVEETALPVGYLIDFLKEKKDGPANELILTLVEDLAHNLGEIINNPRRVLRRERRKVQLGQAQQLDSSCLSWLIKKPGRTAIEKAGGAQKILAVVREESFDTLENRVLKDFLIKANSACEKFLRKYAEFDQSERFEKVRKFSFQVKRMAKAKFFETVKSLNSIPKANYVLQQDPIYSKVWEAYEKLSRREKLNDDLSIWRRMAFRDIIRFIFSLSLVDWNNFEGYDRSSPFNQKLWIREHPDNGSLFSNFDCPLTFLSKSGQTRIVSFIIPESVTEDKYRGFPLKKMISLHGVDLAIFIESPDSVDFDIVFIWSCLTSSGEDISRNDQFINESFLLSASLSAIPRKHKMVRDVKGIWCYNHVSDHRVPNKKIESLIFFPVSKNISDWKDGELILFKKILTELF